MFGNFTLAIINMLITVSEVLIAFVLMDSFFEYKPSKNIIKYISAVAAGGIIFAISFISTDFPIKTPVEILTAVILLFVLYSGEVKNRILYCVIWSIFLLLSETVSSIIVSSIPESAVGLPNSSLFLTTLRQILPKIFLMLFVFFLSGIFKGKVKGIKFKSWLLILSVPMITTAVMTVIQYYLGFLPKEPQQFSRITTITVNGTEITLKVLTVYGFTLLTVIGLLFINILVFILFIREQKAKEVQIKYEILTKQTEMQSSSIEKLENSYMRMRELRHDMQNQLIIVNSLLENGKTDDLKKYVKAMINTVDEAAFMTISGQSAVDALLNEKLLTAHKNSIATDFEIANLEDIFAEPMDLCIILANALDNAVEACVKLPEDRYINLKIVHEKDYILVSCANPSGEEPKRKNNEIVSSKDDSRYHGFGLKSIKTTAKKYNGDVMTRYKDGIFTLIVKLNRI